MLTLAVRKATPKQAQAGPAGPCAAHETTAGRYRVGYAVPSYPTTGRKNSSTAALLVETARMS